MTSGQSASAVRRRFWIERLLFIPRPSLAQQAFEALCHIRGNYPSSDEVSRLFRDYGLGRYAAADLARQMWGAALEKRIGANGFADADIADMDSMRRSLSISDSDALSLKNAVAEPRYLSAAAIILGAGRMSPAERAGLAQLAKSLRIPASREQELYVDAASRALQGMAAALVAKGRLSDLERQSLNGAAHRMGIQGVGAATQAAIDRAGLLWDLEQGQLPAVSVPIALQRGEVCHHVVGAAWQENRSRSVRLASLSIGKSVRLPGGVRLRLGTSVPYRARYEALETIDHGDLYVTNRRLIFRGRRQNSSVTLRGVMTCYAAGGSVVVERANGRPVQFALSGDTESCAIVVNRVMRSV